MPDNYHSSKLDRDESLPAYRENLLHNALEDLTQDPDVQAIYLSGSLARQNHDRYSDIDLHTIVTDAKKADFIRNKCVRARRWGDVLFHEGNNPLAPVVVSHYSGFVKVDSWYHTADEVEASIWLKEASVLYDPHFLISQAIKASSLMKYELEKEEVEFWRGKIFAFVHETYRAVMRKETLYAKSNLDRVAWLIAAGWYMEKDEHFEGAYGSWSKVQGPRSKLSLNQQELLGQWLRGNDENGIMAGIAAMETEILRLNSILAAKAGMEEEREKALGILRLIG